MSDASPSLLGVLTLRPIGVVPDANVFTDRAWMDRLVRASLAGVISQYWSPKIVEEISRVRLWIWLKRELRSTPPPRGSSAWKSFWRSYSEDAHAWFARLSPHVRVIEDHPPHEPAWIEPHPDPNDAWLWNAAQRCRADVVLTVNLSDTPPADTDGLRQHEGIAFMHPRAFMLLLDVWNRIRATGIIPEDLARAIQDAQSPSVTEHGPTVVAQLRVLLARALEEGGTAPGGTAPPS